MKRLLRPAPARHLPRPLDRGAPAWIGHDHDAARAPAARRHKSTAAPTITQVHPRGVYYDILISNPPPYSNENANEPPTTSQYRKPARAPKAEPKPEPTEPTEPAPKPAPTSKAQATASDIPPAAFNISEAPAAAAYAAKQAAREANKKAAEEKARIVFGSRLAGPLERENRLAEIRRRSRRVAGVLLPPKPSEPDNCCMSGCVNCVWDRFRDDMEEWAAANAEVQRRLAAQKTDQPQAGPPPPVPVSVSMDDDGGGSSANWSLEDIVQPAAETKTRDEWEDELYKDVPVGIREFMKQEKRLKMKHMHEGTMGG